MYKLFLAVLVYMGYIYNNNESCDSKKKLVYTKLSLKYEILNNMLLMKCLSRSAVVSSYRTLAQKTPPKDGEKGTSTKCISTNLHILGLRGHSG